MNRIGLFCSILVLGGGAFAQHWTPLPSHQTTEGDGYAYYFGRYQHGRYQFGDGALRKTATVITRVSTRQDARSYTSSTGMGRTWTNVTILLGPTDLTTWSTTFSSNLKGTPTTAFSGSVTWPSISGNGSSKTYSAQHPLTTPYVNLGNDTADLLVDFEFIGGTLANNYSSWTGSTSRNYYTDGFRIASSVSGVQSYYHDTTSSGCVDSNASPNFYRSYSRVYATRYAPTYSTTSYRNKVRIYTNGYYMGRSAPFAQVLGLAGIPTGVPYGSGCEKLYLKFIGAEFITVGAATTSGGTNAQYYGLPTDGVPFLPVMEGLELWTQGMWNDTRTGAVKLTAACSVKVPKLGLTSMDDAKRKTTYRYYTSTTPVLTGTTTTSQYAQPIFKYN